MSKNTVHIIALALLMILILWAIYGDIFIHPNNYLFASGSDGLKNYFTVLYYVKYDSGYHFSGMNYPYGEHIVYTDNQPLLSFLLNRLQNLALDISERIVGIMNTSIFASIVLCVIFIYLILKKLLLPAGYAFMASIVLCFLSPQFSRMNGHYALSYFFFIPALWYFTLRLYEKKQIIRRSIPIILLVTAFAFIHPYYLMMGSLFGSAYLFVYIAQNRKIRKNRGLIISALLCIVFPLFFFEAFMFFTDSVSDRPTNPYGFLSYTASFESVFLPMVNPFIEVWNSFIKLKKAQPEGQAYVGFPGLLVLIVALYRFGVYCIKGKARKIFNPVLPSSLSTAFWASVIVLLFSMGVPFVWGEEFFLKLLPPIKQFRSLGRFAWVFYYVFTVYCTFFIYQMYRLLSIRRLKSLGFFLAFLAFFSWGLYAFINVKSSLNRIQEANQDDSRIKDFLSSGKDDIPIKSEDFSAILGLPFFSIGSEKFSIERGSNVIYETMKVSLKTGLPIVDCMMSRTSVSQTLKVNQLLSSSFIQKDVLQDFPAMDKPLLLLVSNEALLPDEAELVNKAHFIRKNDSFSLYELPLSAFASKTAEIQEFFKGKRQELRRTNGLLSYPAAPVFTAFEDFNDGPCKEGINSSRAALLEQGPLDIFDGILPENEHYSASIWIKATLNTAGFPVAHFELFDSLGNRIENFEINPKFGTEIFKDWVRVEQEFDVKKKANRLKVFITGSYIVADNFLLRPTSVNIFNQFTPDSSEFTFNNYFIKRTPENL